MILSDRKSKVRACNPHLDKMESDHFHHLGINKKDAYMFKNVQYVVMGGANDRMTKFAKVIS